jgi:hypothetical protein
MLTIEKTVLPSPEQWEIIIEGMRNPMNSWDKMDSEYEWVEDPFLINPNDPGMMFVIGDADHQLMTSLAKGGAVHAKYRRMIPVYMTINAPLYWWKEFDTYKIGTVANSCSTMHKIHDKEFTLDDFSCEHLIPVCRSDLRNTVNVLNAAREFFLETKDKTHWWQMIQLLPTSYNQKRTVMLNYEVLVNIYHSRKNHKLDEWHTFCDWIRGLPYSDLITGGEEHAAD